MGKSGQTLVKCLNNYLAQHGAVSDFVRKTGFSRKAVDTWLAGTSFPSVDSLDRIAEGLGITPAELISDHAHSQEDCLRVAADFLAKQIQK